nr:MAG TPA: hypothetical protein [Caudoviricetes sp.]
MKEWIVFYLQNWQELLTITTDGIMPHEITETRNLLAYENNVVPTDITVRKELRREMIL